MKIFGYFCLFAAWSFLVTSCHSSEGNKDKGDSTLVQLNIPVSPATSAQVDSFLQNYYRLKDALVADDSVAAMARTETLAISLEKISAEDIKDENQRKIVGQRLHQLKEDINKMKGDSSILLIRTSFEALSKNTYQLIKVAGLKGKKVYRAYCPMAFHNKGAYWLSNSSDIRNPYFGHKMISCGSVKETLQF